MISVSDFRNGVTFEMDGNVMQIIEFQHVKPGKGAVCPRKDAQCHHRCCDRDNF